jgi:hypothetical protein
MPESEEELLGSFLTSGSYCFDPASYGIEVG